MVHRHAAGIDIGNQSHYVAVAPGRDPEPVREFGSWTADLVRRVDWLKSCGVQDVVMQSTGVYWIAVYDVLEQAGFKVCLANARDTKNLPGRKTDVQESQWLLKLHTYGLLRNSFRPSEEIRRIRTIWRLRGRHVQEAAREIQHMQKALTTMNVQFANAISDLSGVTGQTILRAILKGERDTYKLAEMKVRMAASSLEHSDSYLGARFRHLKSRLGPKKAIKAMAAHLARLMYRMLTHGQAWVDRGVQEHETKRAEREKRSLQRKAAALGFRLEPAA